MRQETLTVVLPVENHDELAGALRQAKPAMFGQAELGIHFARLAVIPSDPTLGLRPWLVLESNFDTEASDPDRARVDHIDLLASHTGTALATILGPCGLRGAADSRAFLVSHLAPPTASYQGHADRDLATIRLEKRLREVVLAFLEKAPGLHMEELFLRLWRHVHGSTDPELAGLELDGPAPRLPDPLYRREQLHERDWPWVMNSAPALSILPKIPFILDWQARDRSYDLRARQEAWTPADHALFHDIAATEDHGLQNALTHVVPLREGAQRLGVLRAAHAYIDRMSQKYFAFVGDLGGIPSIHFAKWLLIDEGRRLLFLSNYDGSWESYLGDFVDQAALGLNLAWSCTREYPLTRLLAFEGASDEETFKAWGRSCQVPTQVFYSAYPDSSIATINNNTLIRHRLHSPADPRDVESFFRRVT
jgi:hypothetical protein